MTPEIEAFMWLTIVALACLAIAIAITVAEITRLRNNLSAVTKSATTLALMVQKLAIVRLL